MEYWPPEEVWEAIFKDFQEQQWIAEYQKWKMRDRYFEHLIKTEGQLEMRFAWEEVRDILAPGDKS